MTTSRYSRYLPVIPGGIALIVYLLTLCRSINIGDGAEFALALKTLGIAHPPGYPLFTFTGSVFVQLFFALRPVVAANLFAALCAAAGVSVLFMICRKYVDDVSAVAVSLVWAFTPAFWVQAVSVDVFSLNLLLILLTLLALMSDARYKWLLVFFLYGLCLDGHPTSLSLAPAIIFVFIKEREYRNWRRLPVYVALFVLAGTTYFYLWARSAQDPISDWGHPVGVAASLKHMTLRQYRNVVLSASGGVVDSAKLLWTLAFSSWWWIGIVAAISGAVIAFRQNVSQAIILLLFTVTSFALAAAQSAADYDPYFLPAMLACLLFISSNFVWMKKFGKLIPAVVGVVAAAVMLIAHYGSCDKSKYTLYEQYSRLILDTADSGVLFASCDVDGFGPLYLRYAENYRPDVTAYDRLSIRGYAMLQQAESYQPGAGRSYYQARAAIFANDKQPNYLVKNLVWNEPNWLPGRDSLYSDGILYSLLRPPETKASLPSFPADFDPGDFLSRLLLANLDLASAEERLQLAPPDSTGALADCRLAIARMKNEPRGECLNMIGAQLRRFGFGDLALEAYNLGLNKPLLREKHRRELLFNISNVYKDRGNAAHQTGNFTLAVDNYIEALNYDSTNSKLLLNIGLIYAQNLNDRDNALVYLNKYLALVPSDARVRDFVNSLR